MSLTKWRALRFVGFLLPLLAYLIVVLLAIPSQRTPGGDRAYVSDDAYRSLTVGRTLAESRIYGASQSAPVPMLHDVLWHGLLGATAFVIRDVSAAASLLGVVFGALTLILLVRLSRLIFPYPFYGYFSAGLMILTPRLATASLSGTSTTLAMCLILAAIVDHMEGLCRTGKGLPKSASLYIGLAMWLRLEFAVVWLLLWGHTLLVACLPADKKPRLGVALFRGLNGLLLLALLVLPIFLWNQSQPIRVPWPRLPGVPMAANDWAELGAGEAWSATVTWIGAGVGEARAAMRQEAIPRGFWARLFFGIGWILFLIQVARSREDRPFSLFLIAPLLLPLLMGLFYPYLGGGSFSAIAGAMRPVMVLVAAYGVVRFPFALQPLLGKKFPVITTDAAFNIWWGVAGGFVILAALIGQIRDVRGHREELAELDRHRQIISEAIEEYALMRDRFATDQPGWLVWTHRVRFLDLQTQWTPDLLVLLSGHSQLRTEQLWQHVEGLPVDRQPTVWLMHTEQAKDFRNEIPEPETIISPDLLEDPERPWMILDGSRAGL